MASDHTSSPTSAVSIELRGTEPVAHEDRHGTVLSAFTLWFAGNIQYSGLVVGAMSTAFLGLSFGQAALSLVVGTLVGSLFLGLAASMGPRAGTPQMIQSRGPFGYYGNFGPVLLLFLTGFGYFAVNTVLGAYIAADLLGLPFVLAVLAVGAVQVVIAVIGHDFVHRVERWLLVIMAVLFVVFTWFGLAEGRFGAPGHAGSPGAVTGAMLTAVALSSSRTFGWSIGASDYTRYLSATTRRGRLTLAAFLGAGLSGLWMHLLGAAIGTVVFPDNPTDLVTRLVPAALATVALITLLCSTIAGSVLDIYSGSLALLMADVPIRRWVSAIATGVLGAVIGWWAGRGDGAFTNFQNFLFLVGYWIGPWLGVTLTDYLAFTRDRVDITALYDRGRRAGPGLVAFLAGLAVSVPFMRQSLFTGPLAALWPQLGDIAYWIGGAVAAIVYYALRRATARRTLPDTAPGKHISNEHMST